MTKAVDLAKTGSLVNSSGQIDLTTGVSGVLPVANGGTGGSSYTATQWTTTGSDIYYNTGNVGIGTSSPGVKLDVNGGSIRAISSGGTPYIYLNNGTTQHSISNSSGAMPFAIDGTEKMRLDSSGNLGLGVTPPSLSTNPGLFIGGNQGLFGTSGVQVGFGTNIYNNAGTWKYVSTAAATLYQPSSGTHVWYYAPSGTAGTSVSFTQAMTLDASGNLTVNTGKIQPSGSPSDPTDSTAALYNGSGIGPVLSGYQFAVRTGSTPSERMRVDLSGNVGIGTSSPGQKFHVAGAGANDSALYFNTIIQNNSTAATSAPKTGINFSAYYSGTSNFANFAGITGGKENTTDNNSAGVLYFCTAPNAGSPTERMRISSTGGLSVGTTADPGAGAIYATGNITAYYSDDRLKTKLGGIENALDKVKSLSGFYYEANQTAQDLGYQPVREVGVSAQQVQAVLPEVVKPAPIDQQYLTVDYERLVPLLIEAIKELEEKVAKLEGK